MKKKVIHRLLASDMRVRDLMLAAPPLVFVFRSVGVSEPYGLRTIREVCQDQHLHEEVIMALLEASVNEAYVQDEPIPAYGLLLLCDWLERCSAGLSEDISMLLDKDMDGMLVRTEEHLAELREKLMPHVREVYELYYSPQYTTGKSGLLGYSMDFFPVHSLPLEDLTQAWEGWEQHYGWDALVKFHELYQRLSVLQRLEKALLGPVVLQMEDEIVRSFQKRKSWPVRMAYVSPPSQSGPADVLSDREKEVIGLLACGYRNKEIADRLSIGLTTVISHRKNISAKLGIKNLAGLTVWAYLNGLLDERILINED